MKVYQLQLTDFGASAFGFGSNSGEPVEILIREENGEFSVENATGDSPLLIEVIKYIVKNGFIDEDGVCYPFDELISPLTMS